MKIKFGFTLAEVLITLAIIGIVSAITIPSVMDNYQKKVYVTSLHKTYNDINQAIQRYLSDKNSEDLFEAGIKSQADLNDFVENYLKYNKKCTNTLSGCFADSTSYRKLNNEQISLINAQSYVLSSGASIRPRYTKSGYRLASFVIDTNGVSKPNILGRDLFALAIYKNGLIDDYKDSSTSAPLSTSDRNSLYDQKCQGNEDASAWGCFGKILNDNWKMNY